MTNRLSSNLKAPPCQVNLFQSTVIHQTGAWRQIGYQLVGSTITVSIGGQSTGTKEFVVLLYPTSQIQVILVEWKGQAHTIFVIMVP